MTEHEHQPIEEIIKKDRYTPSELAEVTGLDVDLINIEIHKGLLPALVVEHDIIDVARADAIAWMRQREGVDAG